MLRIRPKPVKLRLLLIIATAVLGVASAGGAAPRRTSPPAIQRLRAAEAALNQAYRNRNANPGKASAVLLDQALAAYNAAREAVYGKPIEANAAEGSFDGTLGEIEANNTAATAQSLDAVLAQEGSAVLVGEIRAAGDFDYFSFTAEAGQRVWAYVDSGGTQLPGAASRDTVLVLLDTDGTSGIESDDDDGTGNGRDGTLESTQSSVIAGRVLPASGRFYLRLNEFNSDGILAPYRLYVVITDANQSFSESEVNDTRDTADTVLPVGARQGLVTGSVTGADLDFYRVALQAGDVLTVQADEDPARDSQSSSTELILTDFSGAPLFTTNHNNPSFAFGGEAFSWRAVTAGIHFIRVRQASVTTHADYALLATIHARTTGATSLIHGTLGSGSVDYAGISGTQVGRIYRNAVPSNCEAGPKPFPGGNGGGTLPHAFDAYTFKNRSGKEACVQVTLTSYDPSGMHGCIYTTFDPGDHQPGYLGDSGNSATAGSPRTFSVKVAAGAVFVVSLSEVSSGLAVGKPYTLSVTGDFRSSLVGGPADMTVPNDLNQAGAVVNYTPPFPTDPSFGPVVCTPPPGSFFPIGTTAVTCRDQSGSAHTFSITVKDVQPPVIVAPASVNAEQNQAGGAIVSYQGSAGDNAPDANLVCTPPPGSFFPLGATLVNCVATDGAGNTTTRAFLVNVTVPPSTARLRITASGSIATGKPAATFKVTGSVSATGVPKFTVTYTQKTAGQALKATAITAVTRVNSNTVRVFGKMKNGSKAANRDFMLELTDYGKTRPPTDMLGLEVKDSFEVGYRVIKTGDIQIR